MNIFSKIDQGLMRFFDMIMAGSNFVICAMILIGAFMRYVLKKDFYGMEELVLLIAFWMYFIGSAVATREGSQVSADSISSLLKSDKQKVVLTMIRTVISLGLFIVLTKWALAYLLWSLDKRPTTAVYKLPMAIAHASLLLSFALSVLYEIKHGGSVENRARFPLMVLKRIRERIGDKMLLSVRFSASELLKEGITLEDAVTTINLIKQYADIVQCSAGKIHNYVTTGFMFPMQYMDHGCNTYLAEAVRSRVEGIMVETVGGINDPYQAEELVANGVCDLVAMARSFIADPNWAKKAHDGHPEDIRPCIRCLRCLNYAYPPQTGTSICTVNPRRVLPRELEPSEAPFQKKRVAVIGGGPAGMLAAHELAVKGHDVVLYEKSGKLGGVWNLPTILSSKKMWPATASIWKPRWANISTWRFD